MVNINGIQVDLVGNTSLLSARWAIFTVEFEYDSKVIVCHTFDYSVHKGIIDLVNKILSPKVEGLDLRQSFVNSKFITVEVKATYENSPSTILANKYKLIKENMTYYPYGYNFLLLTSTPEKPYAYTLYAELIENIDRSASYRVDKLSQAKQRGKAPKSVYQYEKQTGLFIKKFTSIKEAAESTGICASNISMCCNGHLQTAGGYSWSYEKLSIMDIKQDMRKK